MSESTAEFNALMDRVRAGCPDAARELTEDYGPHILRVVRRRLTRRLRSQFDSLDFMQDVWASFFTQTGDQPQFDHAEELIGFLVHMARNKVLEVMRRRLGGQRFGTIAEQSLERSFEEGAQVVPAKQPTASQVAMADEAWIQLLSLLPEHQQPIAELLRNDYTPAEVAMHLGVAERTVWRVISKLAEGKVG